MIVMALRTDGNQRYSWMKNSRSLFVNWTRPRTLSLGRTLLFCINRARFGVAKRAGQYVAELGANLAFHFVSLATIHCGNHAIQQIVSPFGDSLSNHLRYLSVKEHHFHGIANRIASAYSR